MEHLANYGIARNHPTSRNTERIPPTYLVSSPYDSVYGCPVKLGSFIIAERSGTETKFPVCCVEPFLVSSRVLLRYNDSHDGILFDQDVE